MKNIYFIIAAILILLMLTLPLMTLRGDRNKNDNSTPQSSSVPESSNTVVVLDEATGQTQKMDKSDYLFGVVAAEMPLTYEEEAIKAQTIAANTFLLYRKNQNSDKAYDITLNHETDQSFLSTEQIKEKWGDKTDEYTKKLKNIIDEVGQMYICYDSQPILAAYHAISSGKTENSETVWGSALPYLESVESIGDLLSPDYLTSVIVSIEDFKNAFADKCSLPDDAQNYIEKLERSSCGTVTTAVIGTQSFSGSDIRTAFALRSANFDIALNENGFEFTVRGYGHGVGMSQNGANYMAQQGNTYKEILQWYYKNCEIKSN